MNEEQIDERFRTLAEDIAADGGYTVAQAVAVIRSALVRFWGAGDLSGAPPKPPDLLEEKR